MLISPESLARVPPRTQPVYMHITSSQCFLITTGFQLSFTRMRTYIHTQKTYLINAHIILTDSLYKLNFLQSPGPRPDLRYNGLLFPMQLYAVLFAGLLCRSVQVLAGPCLSLDSVTGIYFYTNLESIGSAPL